MTNAELVEVLSDPKNWDDTNVGEAARRVDDPENNFLNLYVERFGSSNAALELGKLIERFRRDGTVGKKSIIEACPDLMLTAKGAIKKNLANACVLIRHHYAGRISYNVLNNRIILQDVPWDKTAHAIRDHDLNRIREDFVRRYEFGAPDEIFAALQIVANENAVNPIKARLDGLKWDGVRRVDNLFPRYLGAVRSDYTAAVTRLLLSGAVQRVYNPGCKFDYCVVLADTKQGTGKSSLCRFLALDDEWFSDSVGDMSNVKGSFEAIRGKWVCELGEMIATRKTKDVESIKAYISRREDIYREPYARYSENFPRRCVFIGTTNKSQFLPDDMTGNRRFIPVLCDGNVAEVHPLKDEAETRAYILQCYAEIIEDGRRDGRSLTLDSRFAEELREMQEDGTPEDTRVGMIQNWLDNNAYAYVNDGSGRMESRRIDVVCSRMIWDEVFARDANREPTKFDLQGIADIMNLKIEGWRRYAGKSGFGKSARCRFSKYGSQRSWERVARNNENNVICAHRSCTQTKVSFGNAT